MIKRIYKPPRLSGWLLRRLSDYQEKYSIAGDIEEVYYEVYKERGYLRAYLWHWYNSLVSIPQYIQYSSYWSLIMFRNYIITALRIFKKNKLHTITNITGLSLAIAICLVVYFFIHDEVTFDSFHENYDDIHIVSMVTGREVYNLSMNVPIPLGDALLERVNGITYYSKFTRESAKIRYNNKLFTEDIFFADPEFLKMFSFQMLSGNPETALSDIGSILITTNMSEKYFGVENPMGKELQIKFGENYYQFTVTGIVETIPDNSSIKFDFLAHFDFIKNLYDDDHFTSWNNFDTGLFLTIEDKTSLQELEKRLPNLVDDYGMRDGIHVASGALNIMGKLSGALELVPFSDFHFDNSIDGAYLFEQRGDPLYSYILGGIALLILCIACINFTNLSVSQSLKRSKEIGVRKVLGANKQQMIKQLYLESFFMAGISLIVGLVLVEIFIPIFNEITNKNITPEYFSSPMTILVTGSIVLLVALVSGTYPALTMSSFRPVEILQGKLKQKNSKLFSKPLVVFQFSISVFLVISAISMSQQLQYMQDRDLGYNKENIIIIRSNTSDSSAKLQRMKEELQKFPGTVSIALGSGGGFYNNSTAFWVIMTDERDYQYNTIKIDHDFMSTMSIQILEGRNFSPDFPSDLENGVLVNESLLREYGIEDPVGKELIFSGDGNPTIIGVVKDFNYKTLHSDIQPLVMHMFPDWNFNTLFLKIRSENITGLIADMGNFWEQISLEEPLNYMFLDEEVDKLYRSDQNRRKIISIAMGFAIVISCLGLYGISAITAVSRTKEFGIRKVLGASQTGLMTIFFREYFLLIFTANVISWPVAYFALSNWLENFAYRMDISISMFILATVISAIVTVLTVCIHAVKVSITNPINVLRYE